MTEELRGWKTEDGRQKAEGSLMAGDRGDPSSVLCPPSSETRTPILGMTGHFQPGEQERVKAGMRALASLGVRHIRIEMAWADWHETGVREWYQWLMAIVVAAIHSSAGADLHASV